MSIGDGSEEKELRERPLLIENHLGKGTAFLVTAWEYPGDEGLGPFAQDLVRTILQGEQADIRLLSGDRIRYAVYDGQAPGTRKPYSVVYLLNADPDISAPVRLWVRGKLSTEFVIPPGEMRPAYLFGDLAVIPEDKRVDLAAWDSSIGQQEFRFFNAAAQKFEVHNLSDVDRRVQINGRSSTCGPHKLAILEIAAAADPGRKAFFAPGFLNEPEINWRAAGGPY